MQKRDNELCETCKSNDKLKNECETCNKGFYLASDSENKAFCQNCNKIKEFIECYGTIINPICLKCKEGFKLENNTCLEESCVIGNEDKCKTCRNESGRKFECDSCNEGYYLEVNKISYKCLKCSVKNCKKCSNNSGYEICNECESNFILTKDNNNITYSCICPTYYESSEEGICKKTGNWLEAEYDIEDNYNPSELYLLYKVGNTFKLDEVEVYINNTKIPLSISDTYVYYNFEKFGKHKVKINFKATLHDMSLYLM